MFKSNFEKDFARALKRAKINFEYEPLVIKFLQPEKHRKYLPDFRLNFKERPSVFIETKGKLTSEDRKKMVWVRDQNRDKDFVIVFMNSDNKIRKGSPTTYACWAKKNGFEFYDFRKGLPKKWI